MAKEFKSKDDIDMAFKKARFRLQMLRHIENFERVKIREQEGQIKMLRRVRS
jgi:hypothetical protein